MESPIDKADRLGRRRLRLFFVVGFILITQQASFDRFLDGIDGPLRTVDIVALTAWVVLVIAALAALMTGGTYFHSREVRKLMNDELSKANRSDALAGGFMIVVLTAVVLFVASFYWDVSAPEAIHAIVTLGLAGSLLRFATLERKAHANG
jgi:sterol desaturase/sphingolipid hydroxylase (fatty acid hydroxylase superfamily)